MPKPSQDRVEPAVTTMANPEMAREPEPVAAGRKTEGRKVADREDRVERWKIERRKWAERKRRQQEPDAVVVVRTSVRSLNETRCRCLDSVVSAPTENKHGADWAVIAVSCDWRRPTTTAAVRRPIFRHDGRRRDLDVASSWLADTK
jgi:hypothetical protein